MQKLCYGIGEKRQRDQAEHIGERTLRLLEEGRLIEEKLKEIKSCPKPCMDGMVEINISPEKTMKHNCPAIASNCQYGYQMEHALNCHISDIMPKINIPRRHLENFREEKQVEVLAEIDKWPARGFLIFTGNTRSGKSFGAALTVRKFLKNRNRNRFDRSTWETAESAGNSVLWCTAMDIIEDREIAARAKRQYFLVIDDLGGETDTPVGQAALRNIILKRHDMKLATVITTILTLPEIDIRYGSRVTERLIEDIGKGSMIIECSDASMRNSAVI